MKSLKDGTRAAVLVVDVNCIYMAGSCGIEEFVECCKEGSRARRIIL